MLPYVCTYSTCIFSIMQLECLPGIKMDTYTQFIYTKGKCLDKVLIITRQRYPCCGLFPCTSQVTVYGFSSCLVFGSERSAYLKLN